GEVGERAVRELLEGARRDRRGGVEAATDGADPRPGGRGAGEEAPAAAPPGGGRPRAGPPPPEGPLGHRPPPPPPPPAPARGPGGSPQTSSAAGASASAGATAASSAGSGESGARTIGAVRAISSTKGERATGRSSTVRG